MSSVHWTYKDKAEEFLEQGDLLKKTDYLVDVLNRFHPHYAKHADNHFFAVLTQSCDLVVRDAVCKSEYIALAPVRPLRVILEREFGAALFNRKPGAQQFASLATKRTYEDFLTKLFNNNHPKFFFLEKEPQFGLSEDMCIVLPLAISIKEEHYNECKKARFLQLTDAFQAKLGYLIGQQYSKVGTQDWDPSKIKTKVENALQGMIVWVNDADIPTLNKSVEDYETANAGKVIDPDGLAQMISDLPKKKDQAIAAIIDVAIAQKLLPDGNSKERFGFRKALNNDATFGKFFRT